MTYYPDTAEIVRDEAADAYARVAESLLNLRATCEIEDLDRIGARLLHYYRNDEFRLVVAGVIGALNAAKAIWSRCEVDAAEFLDGGGYGA